MPKSKPKPPNIFAAYFRYGVQHRITKNTRKIISPMAPIFRVSPLSDVDRLLSGRIVGDEIVGVIKEIETEISRALELRTMRVQGLKQASISLPRVELLRRWSSLLYTETPDIKRTAERLGALMADHAYKLRRAFESSKSKMVFTPTEGVSPSDMKSKVAAYLGSIAGSLPSINSVGFVIDFSAAGGIEAFLSSFFSALGGNDPTIAAQIRSILSELGSNFVITPKGIARMTKTGPRVVSRGQIKQRVDRAMNKIINKVLMPTVQRHMETLWKEVVEDFFLRMPTSVSRWFPGRPMSRKGLRDRTNSLLGMLLTGKVEFWPRIGVNLEEKGFVGAIANFDTNRAPYWYVVEYGYPGRIHAKEGRGLTLKDPDPSWWRKVQWWFGAPVEKPRFTWSGETPVGVSLHPGGRKRRIGKSDIVKISQKTLAKAKVPVLLPSGRRFTMSVHRSVLYNPRGPVMYGRKVVTYSLTVTPTAIVRESVRGQRASLFVERLIAEMSKRQKILEPAFFNAAAVMLLAGEQEWWEVSKLLGKGSLGG